MGISNKFDNVVIGIFDSALRIYLCIKNSISFLLCDSALCKRVFLGVRDTVDMRYAGGVGVLCKCEQY